MNKTDNTPSFLSLEKQIYVNRTMDGLMNEVGLLQKWFKEEFPECSLRVHVDFSKITLDLSIDIRVMTSKEVSDNQGFFETPIRISERQFMKDSFMSPFLKAFNVELRKNISRAVNNHLWMEKQNAVLRNSS